MIQRISTIAVAMVAVLFCSGCGHYPEPVGFVYDIWLTPKTETAIVITGLSLRHWPKLQKFTELEHLRIFEQMAPQITDEHLKTLSRLNMPKLRDISFAYCSQVTDNGIRALTKLPAIKSLQLLGVGITDEGLKALVTGLPRLEGINVSECRGLTYIGFLGLTNSPTVTGVGFSQENLSQDQIERLISKVTNVTWWTIQDRNGTVNLEPLRKLKKQMNITIQISDSKCIRGI